MFKQLLNIKRNINECNFAVMKEFAAKNFSDSFLKTNIQRNTKTSSSRDF